MTKRERKREKHECLLNDKFEIKNGLLGINRDIFLSLIRFLYFDDGKIKQILKKMFYLHLYYVKMIGICQTTVKWINHTHFSIARSRAWDVSKIIVSNVKKNLIEIDKNNIIFRLFETYNKGLVFINVLIKNMILEW
jgi:hypothetical protein